MVVAVANTVGTLYVFPDCVRERAGYHALFSMETLSKGITGFTVRQFVNAVAVAMTTLRPVVIPSGYLVTSFAGACVVALSTFLLGYAFVVPYCTCF